MATIELRHVWKKYGEVQAVRDLSLTCRDGEFMCLLGPSGCGKSSTMRMVAGLEKITAGDLLMDDRRVNDVPARDRDIAMVFENYALYPHLNVFDNIAMPLRAPGASRDRSSGSRGRRNPFDHAALASPDPESQRWAKAARGHRPGDRPRAPLVRHG